MRQTLSRLSFCKVLHIALPTPRASESFSLLWHKLEAFQLIFLCLTSSSLWEHLSCSPASWFSKAFIVPLLLFTIVLCSWHYFTLRAQQVRAAPSICVCALKCYHGCLHRQGSKSEPWLSPYRVISAIPVRTRGSFYSQTVCQLCTVIVPKASLHGGHSSLIGRCEQLTALGCWM